MPVSGRQNKMSLIGALARGCLSLDAKQMSLIGALARGCLALDACPRSCPQPSPAGATEALPVSGRQNKMSLIGALARGCLSLDAKQMSLIGALARGCLALDACPRSCPQPSPAGATEALPVSGRLSTAQPSSAQPSTAQHGLLRVCLSLDACPRSCPQHSTAGATEAVPVSGRQTNVPDWRPGSGHLSPLLSTAQHCRGYRGFACLWTPNKRH